MKITFLGTRGCIEPANRRHRRHTATLVAYRGRRVMIDCGEDWRGQIERITPKPQAIVLTHAHPDHAAGLKDGVKLPVYAPDRTWEVISRYPIEHRHTLPPDRTTTIRGIGFRPFTVEHSLNCPAVAYRIGAGRATICYAPDVIYIHDRRRALRGVDLYIGDGASVHRPLVRKRGERLIGHASVKDQITWCGSEGVDRAVITHCGSGIVAGDERKILPGLRKWGRERGVEVEIAHDRMEIVVR